MYAKPFPHPSGATPPVIAADLLPKHVAIVMDGNGRWANARGLPRTKGHEAGEASLLDVVAGAIDVGVTHLSAYAFSTENWRRSPEEVRFLMGFNRDVIRRRRDQLHEWGVRMRWVGRTPRLWRSVIKELEVAQELTQHNTGLTLYFCVNYGGRAEIADAVQRIAHDVKAGRLRPGSVDERTIKRYLDEPTMPDVDLFVRSSGEQRTSNFLLWQSAYAEMVFQNRLWPDYDRRDLWAAVEDYVAPRPPLRRGRRHPALTPPARHRATVTRPSRSHTGDCDPAGWLGAVSAAHAGRVRRPAADDGRADAAPERGRIGQVGPRHPTGVGVRTGRRSRRRCRRSRSCGSRR